jgi:Ferritin-like
VIADLSTWPTPGDKAKVLLETLADAEHALLVAYLYAGDTLKSSDADADPDGFVLNTWSALLPGTIAQMKRFMTVQDLLIAIGLAPQVAHADAGAPGLRPLSRHVEPLTQRSLAKYVAAEAPASAGDIAGVLALAAQDEGQAVNRVGALYELLAVVFSTAEQLTGPQPPADAWEERLRTVAAAAHAQAPAAAWHLPDGAIDPQTVDHQASGSWGGVLQVTDRTEALDAIRQLGEPRVINPQDGSSPFERLLTIYSGGDGTPPFPAAGATWIPARPVPADGRPQDIAEPRTRGWAQLADLRYALLLGAIEHHLRTADEDDRSTFAGWAFAEMNALKNTSPILMALPRGTGIAALPFTLADRLPDVEIERWRVHETRTRSAIATATALTGGGTSDAESELADLMNIDRARLDDITARIAALQPA